VIRFAKQQAEAGGTRRCGARVDSAPLDFLNRLRQEDAFNSVIHRTQLSEQNQLGVVLLSNVALETVPDLMRKVMTEVSHEFHPKT
jgi:hypothetical protein